VADGTQPDDATATDRMSTVLTLGADGGHELGSSNGGDASGATKRACANRCVCGAPLTLETRQGHGVLRTLALCANPECGHVSFADGEGGLKTALLGHRAVRRYLAPWLRTYFRATRLGYRWRPHIDACSACGNAITVALDLQPLIQRPRDPLGVSVCLQCGATACAYWCDGERVDVAFGPDAWHEPNDAVQRLKRALSERAEEISLQSEEPW
jgi:hypothetical protein